MSAVSWSRRLSNMLRHLSNKIFSATLCALISVNQMLSLAPVRRQKVQEEGKYFHLQRWTTAWGLVSWMLLVLLSPLFIQGQANIYDFQVGENSDELFSLVALTTTVFEVISSLLILPTILLKRKQLSSWLNNFMEIMRDAYEFRQKLFSWRMLLLLYIRIAYTIYLVAIDLPFIFTFARHMKSLDLLGFFGILYLQQLSFIFALDVFVAFLCFYAILQQLKRNLKTASDFECIQRLSKLEQSLQDCAKLFTEIFEFPILLILLEKFVNLLANLYALLNYYASIHTLYYRLVFFCIFIFADLYSLIFAAYCCCSLHERVKVLLLKSRIFRFRNFINPLWPCALEFRILDMFSLDHEFWLFLVSYSASYVVLILQFSIEKRMEIKSS